MDIDVMIEQLQKIRDEFGGDMDMEARPKYSDYTGSWVSGVHVDEVLDVVVFEME